MSSEATKHEPLDPGVAISVRSLSKEYRIFGRPHQRVLEPLFRRLGSTREFGMRIKAVDDVSFDVKSGSTLAIIGRNGSGKSTLLEMITGTLSSTRGAAVVDGRVSALLELGAGFNPDFTGRQNYRLNASILGLDDREIELVEPDVERFAELGSFMDEPVRTYSSGMYVRLAFATAVHVKPEILIVDEALAVGDVFFQQKCFDFLERELSNATKLLVTHDLAMAAKLADRCVVMDAGKVVFDGGTLDGIQAFTSISLRNRAPDSGEEQAEAAERPESERIRVQGDGASSPEAFSISTLTAQQVDPETGIASPLVELPWMCIPGHEIRISLSGVVGVEVEAPVLGYLVRDRVGNVVFGENTIGSQISLRPMEPGSVSIDFGFVWPEVAPGDYTLTVGLGDGLHSHFHRIVGWVQGVASMTSVPTRPVHGLINNELSFLTVARA
jgi:ABC-type polysaccharide/polyol phosphate transport system ATPase subunit